MKKSLLFGLLSLFPFGLFAQVNLNKGLEAYYPFTGNAKDSSGHGINGKVSTSGATLAADRFGHSNSAYHFDGKGYIDLGDTFNNVIAGPDKVFSISVWVRPADKANNFILGKNSDAGCSIDERQFAVRIRDKKPNMTYFHTLTSQDYWTVSGDTDIEPNDFWYHIVMIYDGSTTIMEGKDRVKIYVNGEQYESYYYPLQPTSSQKQSYIKYGTAHFGIASYLTPSGSPCAPSDNYIGDIDDIRIYSRALNEDEIKCLYEGCSSTGIMSSRGEEIGAYIYPNPSQEGIFYLKPSTALSNLSLEIRDIQGKIISSANLASLGSAAYKIDLSSQPAGIYLVSVHTATSIKYFKVVKD